MNPDVCYEHGNSCETQCKGCICNVLMKEDCESCNDTLEEELSCRREVRPISDKGYWESYWVHIKDCKGDHEYITN